MGFIFSIFGRVSKDESCDNASQVDAPIAEVVNVELLDKDSEKSKLSDLENKVPNETVNAVQQVAQEMESDHTKEEIMQADAELSKSAGLIKDNSEQIELLNQKVSSMQEALDNLLFNMQSLVQNQATANDVAAMRK